MLVLIFIRFNVETHHKYFMLYQQIIAKFVFKESQLIKYIKITSYLLVDKVSKKKTDKLTDVSRVAVLTKLNWTHL
jgi:hypothetical protein